MEFILEMILLILSNVYGFRFDKNKKKLPRNNFFDLIHDS